MEFATTDCKSLAHLLTDYSIWYQREKSLTASRGLAFSKSGNKKLLRAPSVKVAEFDTKLAEFDTKLAEFDTKLGLPSMTGAII